MSTYMTHQQLYAREAAWTSHLNRVDRDRVRLSWREYDVGKPRMKCQGTLATEYAPDEEKFVLAICDGCGFELAVRREDIDPQWREKDLVKRSGLPFLLLDKSFDQREESVAAYEAAKRYCNDPVNEKPPLLHGRPGVGKTHLLTRAGKRLCAAGLRVLYRDWGTMLTAEREFIDYAKGQRPLEQAQQAEILILDDLGAERATPWTQEQLQQLVDNRYRANRPILAATNLELDQWAETFGERTASRLGGMCEPVFMGGADMRIAA